MFSSPVQISPITPKPQLMRASAGGAAVVQEIGQLLSMLAAKQMKKSSENLSGLERTAIQEAGEKIIANTKLKQAGIKILYACENSAQNISSKLNVPLAAVMDVARGNNAFFDGAKTVVMPKKGLELAVFHELGHAANAHLNKLTRLIGKGYGLPAIAAPAIAFAAMANTLASAKPGYEQITGKKPGILERAFNKTHQFIKDNAGKLTFLSFTPMLLEEGLASARGYNLAKQAQPLVKGLTDNVLKKSAITKACGFATYFIAALTASLSAYLLAKSDTKNDTLSRQSFY